MNKRLKISLMFSFLVLGTVIAIVFGTQKEVMPIGSSLPKLQYYSNKESGYILTKSKPLIIMFFKPDCPHCEYEFEIINKRLIELNDVEIFFITTDRKFIKKKCFIKWDNLANAGNVVFAYIHEDDYKKQIGINTTPIFLIYGSNEKLTDKILGETKFESILGAISGHDGSKHHLN